MDKITLNNGNKIPSVGFGEFMIPNGKDTFEAVRVREKIKKNNLNHI